MYASSLYYVVAYLLLSPYDETSMIDPDRDIFLSLCGGGQGGGEGDDG